MLEQIGFMDIGLAVWPSGGASSEAEGNYPDSRAHVCENRTVQCERAHVPLRRQNSLVYCECRELPACRR